jgi:predicted O-methyltransferase YrrM
MSDLTLTMGRTPVLGRAVLTALRAKIALSYYKRPAFDMLRWLMHSRETTNFTYDLEEHNKRYLAALIADVVGVEFERILAYIREIEEDAELRSHIAAMTADSSLAFIADQEARYGRRIGWYAIARAIKPRVIIETGIDKGLGACVLAAALRKNLSEGYAGTYYGTDINPQAGYLLTGIYAPYGKILYGDSIESLRKVEGPVDLFINDSDHSAEYEAAEYKVIASKLSEKGIVLGDNAHCTDKLLQFSLDEGRSFVFFSERPDHHWYPGGGIGISFRR